jgi:hypothetical protein
MTARGTRLMNHLFRGHLEGEDEPEQTDEDEKDRDAWERAREDKYDQMKDEGRLPRR